MTLTPAQHAAAVLSRQSVLDLIEAAPADIALQAQRFEGLELLTSARVGFYFHSAQVLSGERVHEVRLFENWFYCDCETFFYRVILKFSISACRHSCFAMSKVDPRSFARIIDQESVRQGRERIEGAILASPKVKAVKFEGMNI